MPREYLVIWGYANPGVVTIKILSVPMANRMTWAILPPTMGSMLIPPPPPILFDLTTKPDELTSGVSTLRQKLAGGTTSEVGVGAGLDDMLVEVGVSSDDDAIVAGSVLADTFVGEGVELNELID